ncbi:hypothetical protein ARMGADRAFT_1079989 [Armillaria gallica]|uniref:Uncharacterized protein n=1 Tax=Armillaria gallica TaxID=47427 RepID=A0A2H3DEQ4_ARMGA|nr:hypothetical protein ARMGADRAFT_1079989 [Armillaria gallica]
MKQPFRSRDRTFPHRPWLPPQFVTRIRRLLAPLTSFRLHPLDPLTPDEIAAVSLPVRHHIASKTDISAIKFITTYPLPYLKKVLLAYLGIPLTPGGQSEASIPATRKAKVDFLDVCVNSGSVSTKA